MSTLTIRQHIAQLLGKSFGGKRDLYDVFGYQKQLRAEDFYALYRRGGIAKRIIKAYPQATWRDMPDVKDEGDETDKENTFSEAFRELYEENQLSNYFERADRLASLGQFGVLMLGFQDGKSVAEPLEKGDYPLIYAMPYSERSVTINSWDRNTNSPRYGLPETYTIQTSTDSFGKQTKGMSKNVHHTRVIHISEMLDEDEVYGIPFLEAIFNHLKDLEKVVGGSAEMFWLAAYKGLALIADKDATLEDPDKVKEQIEEYQHELRRFMTLQGMNIHELGGNTADPKGNVDVIIDLISGTTGIPKRILMGNEAGELASSQDETNWNARVDERRNTFAGPMIVKPFVDKMIFTGNLPEPKGKISIEWDEADALSEKEIADIDNIRAKTADLMDRVGFSIEAIIETVYPTWTEDEVKQEINRQRSQPAIPQNGLQDLGA